MFTLRGAQAGLAPRSAEETPDIHRIIATGTDDELMQILHHHDALVKVCTPADANPLHTAVLCGKTKYLLPLLRAEALIDHQDKNGFTPLLTAVIAEQTEAALTLIKAGANIWLADKDGTTPLLAAIIARQTEVALSLIDAGADADVADKGGATPLKRAIELNNIELIKKLLPISRALGKKEYDQDDYFLSCYTTAAQLLLQRTIAFRRLYYILSSNTIGDVALVQNYFQKLLHQLVQEYPLVFPDPTVELACPNEEGHASSMAETFGRSCFRSICALLPKERNIGLQEFAVFLKHQIARDDDKTAILLLDFMTPHKQVQCFKHNASLQQAKAGFFKPVTSFAEAGDQAMFTYTSVQNYEL